MSIALLVPLGVLLVGVVLVLIARLSPVGPTELWGLDQQRPAGTQG